MVHGYQCMEFTKKRLVRFIKRKNESKKWIKDIKRIQLNTFELWIHQSDSKKVEYVLICVCVCRHGPVSCISSFLMSSSLSVTCATSLRSLRQMKSYFLKELLSWFVPNWNTVLAHIAHDTCIYSNLRCKISPWPNVMLLLPFYVCTVLHGQI